MLRKHIPVTTPVEAIRYMQHTRNACIELLQERGFNVNTKLIDDDGVEYESAHLFIHDTVDEKTVMYGDYVIFHPGGGRVTVLTAHDFVDRYAEVAE